MANPSEFTNGIIIGIASSDPTGLKNGQLYLNSVSGKIRKFNGTIWEDVSTGLAAVVDDTTPQLGGDLDLNSSDITGTGNIDITGTINTNGDASFGASTSVKVLLGNWGGAGLPGLWIGENTATPSYSNYALLWDNGTGGTIFNAPSGKNMSFRIGNSTKIAIDNATGNVSITDNLAVTGATTSTTFNGVALTTGGDDKKFLNELGTYTTAPAAAVTVNVQALTSSPADGATAYFGNLPKAPTTTANISKIYFRRAGTINVAEIYNYSGTAGTNEAWSLYVRKNNTTDYLIATVSAATNERVFSNTAMSIPIVSGDYVEIKMVNPTWVTNPLTCIFGGYLVLN